MKKTILCTLSAAALSLLLLSGCAKDEPASSSSASSVAPPPPSSSSAPPAPEYVRGTVTEAGFISEFWDLAFVAPSENVMMANADQMRELMGLGGEMLGTDEATLEQMQGAVELCEMAAVDMTTGAHLLVVSTPLPMSGVNADLLLQASKGALTVAGPELELTFDNEGEPVDAEVAGKTLRMISFTAASEAGELSQRVYALVEGKRALTITLGYSADMPKGQESAEKMLAALTTVTQAPAPEDAAPEAKADAEA